MRWNFETNEHTCIGCGAWVTEDHRECMELRGETDSLKDPQGE